MALHLKSHTSFKIAIGLSALLISAMAAIFSVTGIATLFSGYFITVAIMMGTLEFGKIIVASFLARYWEELTKSIRAYFLLAVFILILITSGGIFGYLSDAYQKTKGDYTLVEKEVSLIETKIELFSSEKNRYQNRIDALNDARRGQEARLDTLYSRGQITSARRVETQIKAYDEELSQLVNRLNTVNDSISVYETNKVTKESQNITGELGPLKYIAGIFDTDMDTIVKYFIFMLIFVFDPLAILLFVSINLIIKKEQKERENNSDYTKVKYNTADNKKDIESFFTDKEIEIASKGNGTVFRNAPPANNNIIKNEYNIEAESNPVNEKQSEFDSDLVKVLIDEYEQKEKINNKTDEAAKSEIEEDDNIDKKESTPSDILFKSANYHPPSNK